MDHTPFAVQRGTPLALQRASAAFRAYLQLGRLPRNAPPWNLNHMGAPIMHSGEIYCRMPDPEGHCCGKASTTLLLLQGHVRKEHGVVWEDYTRIPLERRQIEPRKAFYNELMKFEDYPGKDGAITQDNIVPEQVPARENGRNQQEPPTSRVGGDQNVGRYEARNNGQRAQSQEQAQRKQNRPSSHRPQTPKRSTGFQKGRKASAHAQTQHRGGKRKRTSTQQAKSFSQYVDISDDDDEEDLPPRIKQELERNLERSGRQRTIPSQTTAASNTQEPEDDEQDLQWALDEVRINRQMAQHELQEVQLKRKMAALKKRKMGL